MGWKTHKYLNKILRHIAEASTPVIRKHSHQWSSSLLLCRYLSEAKLRLGDLCIPNDDILSDDIPSYDIPSDDIPSDDILSDDIPH